MKNTSRRKFIRNSTLAAGGIVIAGSLGAERNESKEAGVSCAPSDKPIKIFRTVANTVTTVKSGSWSDASIWGGKLPQPTDAAIIAAGHTVIFDLESGTISGLGISKGATLTFDANKSSTLQASKNIVVEGKLQMKPASSAVIQLIRFVDVDETLFVGGGMNVLDTDTGLWVMGDGQLELVGTSKTAWTRANAGIGIADTTVSLKELPDGWLVGDEISITPTESPVTGAAFISAFDDKSITKISGSTITLNNGITYPHPRVNNQWTAEVMNLTRNVRIEGTINGKSHVFIRSTKPQTIAYTQLRYMGPRKDQNSDGIKELVLGRYGLHFHHSDDGSRGSTVEGCIIRNTDSHAYVPHLSNGITFKNNVSYDTKEVAYWWDRLSLSHDIIYDGNIAARVGFVNASISVDLPDDPTNRNIGTDGFLLGMGDGNVAINNVVVGGDTGEGGGFDWDADNEGVWVFSDNMVHNSNIGLRVWQNTANNHVIENNTLYYNKAGIFHGAYANNYTYKGGEIYGCGILIEASSVSTLRVNFHTIKFDGAGFVPYLIEVKSSPIPTEYPIFIRNCSFSGFTVAAISDIAELELKCIDVVQCTSTGTLAVIDKIANTDEVIRIQSSTGEVSRLTKSGKENISAFAPTIWGDGAGLKGDYYNDATFTSLVLTRVDSVLCFQQWSTGIHYSIKGQNHSVRWTGKIQPQYTESYTFKLHSSGGHRLWVDDRLILDKWEDNYPDLFTSTAIELKAGEKYNIKLEYFNKDERTGVELFWQSKTLALEYVPQSQMFPSDAVSPYNPPPGGRQVFITGQIVRDYIRLQSAGNFDYALYDGLGRLLMRGKIIAGQNNIGSSHLSKGIIYLRVSNGETHRILKL